MITDVEVEDYQSIHKAQVKLGRFTVITGPTGSGKSGLLRAMRLVAFNARGASFIRHGAKSCQVALGFEEEQLVVGIARGGRGSDRYRVVTMPTASAKPGIQEFTKLGGEVPDQVREVVNLSEVNFAGQFDRPYLLTESGSQVARVLGELTNVTLVFDAAREANRRKLENARELKAAETRLAALREQGRQFRGLKGRVEAVRDARDRLDSMAYIQDNLTQLEALAQRHDSAVIVQQLAQQNQERATPPSSARLEELLAQWTRLDSLAADLDTAARWQARAAEEAQRAEVEAADASLKLHELLVEAGTCPTCGQEVSPA